MAIVTFSLRKTIALAAVIVLIAAVVIVVAASRGDSRDQLIGLGDSYASGEGLTPYALGTDTADNRCHQSVEAAYPVIAAKLLSLHAVNHSCSGATTDSIKNQIADLKKAKIITVTIGGNDIDALSAVFSPPDPTKLAGQLKDLQPKLVNTYKQVVLAAPKATVVVTGYPDLFPVTAPSDCFLNQPSLTQLGEELTALNAVIKAAAEDAGVRYVELGKTFEGHELCTGDPYANGISLGNVASSLHPNLAGQAAMAKTVSAVARR